MPKKEMSLAERQASMDLAKWAMEGQLRGGPPWFLKFVTDLATRWFRAGLAAGEKKEG